MTQCFTIIHVEFWYLYYFLIFASYPYTMISIVRALIYKQLNVSALNGIVKKLKSLLEMNTTQCLR